MTEQYQGKSDTKVKKICKKSLNMTKISVSGMESHGMTEHCCKSDMKSHEMTGRVKLK